MLITGENGALGNHLKNLVKEGTEEQVKKVEERVSKIFDNF